MTEPTKLVEELDALFARATGGPWEMYQTARPRHFEIGPSQRKIVAMMTTDSTEDNDFGYDNARLLQALVNAWPQLRGMALSAPSARAGALEEAERVCAALAADFWKSYKEGDNNERGNPYFEGASDTADKCAQLIHALPRDAVPQVGIVQVQNPDGSWPSESQPATVITTAPSVAGGELPEEPSVVKDWRQNLLRYGATIDDVVRYIAALRAYALSHSPATGAVSVPRDELERLIRWAGTDQAMPSGALRVMEALLAASPSEGGREK